jgi:membrane protease YdiL (CAAX protease family)
LLVASTTAPVVMLLGLFAAVLLAGLLWPATASWDVRVVDVRMRMAVLLVGVVAFAIGRVLGGGHAPHPLLFRLVLLNSFAAVAEEAFFRRFVFNLLRPNGAALAIAGSAALFAIVHVTVYGAWVLPIDLAAGMVLGWQRWAADSWHVSAVTHVLANLLVVI